MLNILPTVKKTNSFFAPFRSFYTSAVDIIYMHLAPTSGPSALRDWVRRGCLGFLVLHLCLLLQENDRQSPAAHHPPALCLWLVWTFSSSSIIYRTSLTDSTALSFFLFSAWAPVVVSPPQDRWSWRCHRASIRRRRTTASLWSGTSPPERTARPVCFLSSATW